MRCVIVDDEPLALGILRDYVGRVPLLECVKRAEKLRMETSPNRGYLPIDGLAAYDRAVQELVFGADSAALRLIANNSPTANLPLPHFELRLDQRHDLPLGFEPARHGHCSLVRRRRPGLQAA